MSSSWFTRSSEFDVPQVEWPPPSPRSALEIWPAAVESSESQPGEVFTVRAPRSPDRPEPSLSALCAKTQTRQPRSCHGHQKPNTIPERWELRELTHTGALTITVIWNPRTFLFNDKDRSQFYTFSRLTRILWKRNKCSTLRKWRNDVVKLYFDSLLMISHQTKYFTMRHHGLFITRRRMHLLPL